MEQELEYSDRVLFFYSNSTSEWEKYVRVLESQKKEIQKLELSTNDINPKNTFDLIIICLTSESDNSSETLNEIKKLFRLSSTPCILISPSSTNNIVQNGLSNLPQLKCIDLEQEISTFLVATKLFLRLRKMRTEHVHAQVEVVSENATLRDLNNRFNKDILEAREIHERLLPDKLPIFNSLNFASYYLPLELVGGDLFDIWEINEDTAAIFLGDITGHGLPAAFIAAMTKMCMALSPEKTPAKILSFLNKNLSNYLPDGRFITAVCAFIDTKNNILTYSSAGHPPPLHYVFETSNAKGLIERGMPLNIDKNYEFTESKVQISKGDKILFYTDGLYETVNMSNIMMGIDTLTQEFIKISKNSQINEILENLAKFQEDYTCGRTFKDDLTMLGVEITC
jgi:serine phosphatase RsbU (regulator of sigma subunit)